MVKERDGVDKLNALLPGGGASQEEPLEPLSDEEIEEKVEKIFALTAKLAKEDVFLMQDLLNACAEEIQVQIRELVLKGDDDERR